VNATQKFYTGFVIALALVIGAAFFAGYQTGSAHARGEVRAHRAAP
jgi:hypothetical protein